MTELREELQSYLSGAYELGRELTGGGMSRVFVAQDAVLGRRVVVKVLPPDLAAGINVDRFRREITLAAHLQHAHIVPVLTAGTAGTLPYFVMPFVDGESLRARLLGEQGIPVVEAVWILRDVARALGFAHSHGVVHRDIKPDNVLLAGGSAVVTDFGIAKAISSARVEAPGGTLTQAGTSLGTPAYMSPEQAAGDPNADARSDFYSFGVMAYEMLTGKPPFHDRPTHSLVMAHIAEPPEPIERQLPSIPAPLAALVMQCLAKNPSDRPQTAREILDALDDLDLSAERGKARAEAEALGLPYRGVTTPNSGPQGTIISPPRDPVAIRSGDTGPRAYADGTVLITPEQTGAKKTWGIGRIALLIGAAAALVAVGILGGRFLKNRAASGALDDSSLAVVPFRVASADPSLHYLREGMVDLIAAKLSGEEMRAVEPRTMLDAWQSAGGSDTNDLAREANLQVARQLGASRALLGDVVGTPNRLVLNVSLVDVNSGSQVSRISVDGPPDSLASLVDRIATQILTETSKEGATRISALTGVPLPALRAYLDGQSRLRKGEAIAAAKDFTRALDEDSTFALAGLGVWLAAGWYGDPQLSSRGIKVAWSNKTKLSPRDQTMLLALAGPNYPNSSTATEILKAREAYASAAQDNAEAAYLLADHIFHFGSVLGLVDWEKRALDGFRRAMELDSTYLPGYIHAIPLAPYMGDSAFTQKATRLLLTADTSQLRQFEVKWYSAARRGDNATADALWKTVPSQNGEAFLSAAIRHFLFDGTGPEYAKRAIEQFYTIAHTDLERHQRARYAHEVFTMLGRPTDALRYLELSADSATDLNVPILKLRDATMGEVPRSIGDGAAKQIHQFELGEPTDTTAKLNQRAVIRVMEPWRLMHGDTSQTARSLARLRAIGPSPSSRDSTAWKIEIGLIEAMHADVTHSAALKQILQRVDSVMMQLEYGGAHPGRLAQTAVTLARLWEKVGDENRALAMVMRHPEWNSEAVPYIAAQLREEARIAARAGQRSRAQRSAGRYLGLRTIAEPARRPPTDSVRREAGLR
ncbi:MAG TPA: serine/threonine-protein kinase [Gemmatimonadaceae bacterium]|nr:serine/threonine-protein kinase [Gemmatimonadaceae bacterium]